MLNLINTYINFYKQLKINYYYLIIIIGGGFSSLYPTQSWQQSVVDSYLSTATPAYGGYNSDGRGYPDISSLGYNYYVVIAGQDIRLSGTSASTPVTAALISLVNSQRIAAGKSSLGWFNPALYSMYNSDNSMVNDVISGENNCTAGEVCCEQGFNAAAGWDPLTGNNIVLIYIINQNYFFNIMYI
jgi:tripeptidyl-peptidase-1